MKGRDEGTNWWIKKVGGASAEVSGFGNKCRKVFFVVIVRGVIIVSIFLVDRSRSIYSYESMAFFYVTVQAGDDVMVFNHFLEGHVVEDAFHVGDGILG